MLSDSQELIIVLGSGDAEVGRAATSQSRVPVCTVLGGDGSSCKQHVGVPSFGGGGEGQEKIPGVGSIMTAHSKHWIGTAE